jgi:hypothetical protein
MRHDEKAICNQVIRPKVGYSSEVQLRPRPAASTGKLSQAP